MKTFRIVSTISYSHSGNGRSRTRRTLLISSKISRLPLVASLLIEILSECLVHKTSRGDRHVTDTIPPPAQHKKRVGILIGSKNQTAWARTAVNADNRGKAYGSQPAVTMSQWVRRHSSVCPTLRLALMVGALEYSNRFGHSASPRLFHAAPDPDTGAFVVGRWVAGVAD